MIGSFERGSPGAKRDGYPPAGPSAEMRSRAFLSVGIFVVNAPVLIRSRPVFYRFASAAVRQGSRPIWETVFPMGRSAEVVRSASSNTGASASPSISDRDEVLVEIENAALSVSVRHLAVGTEQSGRLGESARETPMPPHSAPRAPHSVASYRPPGSAATAATG